MILFILDEKQINDKITEVISKSDLFSPSVIKTDLPPEPDKEDLKHGISDYHFSIDIGWDESTSNDEYTDTLRDAWVGGSLGLFPATFTDEIKMNIHVTSEYAQLKTYHYQEAVTYVYWAPMSLTRLLASAKRNGYHLILKNECIPKIESMMKEFIKHLTKELGAK